MAGPLPQPLSNYDPNQVSVYFNNFLIDGFEPGTLIDIDYEKDQFTDKADVSGSVVRSKTNDYRATITFTLQGRSVSNQTLSNIANTDRATGAGFGPIKIEDNLSSDLCIAAAAWIVRPATIKYGSEAEPRVWKLRCDNLIQNQGN